MYRMRSWTIVVCHRFHFFHCRRSHIFPFKVTVIHSWSRYIIKSQRLDVLPIDCINNGCSIHDVTHWFMGCCFETWVWILAILGNRSDHIWKRWLTSLVSKLHPSFSLTAIYQNDHFGEQKAGLKQNLLIGSQECLLVHPSTEQLNKTGQLAMVETCQSPSSPVLKHTLLYCLF